MNLRNRLRLGVVVAAFGLAVCVDSSRATAAEWQLRPITARGGALPGGGTLLQVGEIFPLAPGDFAFWARFAGEQWALYRWTDGDLSRLLVDGVDFSLAGLAEPVRVKYARGGTTLPTAWFASGGRVFLEARFSSTKAELLLLDRQGLRKLVSSGDPIPGSSGRVGHVHPIAAGYGRVLFFLRGEKPDKSARLGLWAGESWHVLVSEDGEIPGSSGARVRSLDYHARAAVVSDGVLVELATDEGPALFALSSSGGEKRLAQGDPMPGGGGERTAPWGFLGWLGDFAGTSTRRFLASVAVGEGKVADQRWLVAYSDGELARVPLAPELGSSEFDVTALRLQALDLSALHAIAVLLLRGGSAGADEATLGTVFLASDGSSWAQLEGGGDLCCTEDDPYEFEVSRRLTDYRIRPAGAGLPGALVSVSPGAWSAPPGKPGMRRVKGAGLLFHQRAENPVRSLYLDPSEPTRLQEPPRIVTDQGPLDVGSVMAWLTDDQGVVLREGGLHLVDRSLGETVGARGQAY